MDEKKKQKILKRQEKLRNVLLSLSDKIKIDDVKAQQQSSREMQRDNKEMTIDGIRDEISDSDITIVWEKGWKNVDENLNTLDELVRTSREYRDILADIENFKYGERIAEFIERMDGSIKEIKDIIYDVRQEVLSFYKAQKEGNVKGTKESKDSNYFFHSYQEYYEGLIDYIKKINEAILKSNGVDNEEKINIIKKLDAVIEKDNQFKDSIEMKDCDLSELILNIETAIDVIPFLEKCKRFRPASHR